MRLKKAGLLPKQQLQRQQEAAMAQASAAGRMTMHVLYATQTGGAESLAKDVREDATEKGFVASIHDRASFPSDAGHGRKVYAYT